MGTLANADQAYTLHQRVLSILEALPVTGSTRRWLQALSSAADAALHGEIRGMAVKFRHSSFGNTLLRGSLMSIHSFVSAAVIAATRIGAPGAQNMIDSCLQYEPAIATLTGAFVIVTKF